MHLSVSELSEQCLPPLTGRPETSLTSVPPTSFFLPSLWESNLFITVTVAKSFLTCVEFLSTCNNTAKKRGSCVWWVSFHPKKKKMSQAEFFSLSLPSPGTLCWGGGKEALLYRWISINPVFLFRWFLYLISIKCSFETYCETHFIEMYILLY